MCEPFPGHLIENAEEQDSVTGDGQPCGQSSHSGSLAVDLAESGPSLPANWDGLDWRA
jgi:hypothetical protein